MTLFTTQLTSQLRAVRPPTACGAGAPTLVVVAHGSRDPEARRTVGRLVDRVRRMRPGVRVELGHIELNGPLLGDTLAGLPEGERAVLVPLLFGRGHHVLHDIPRAVEAAPHVRATVAGPLGPHPLLAEALRDRLAEAGALGADGVVLAAAGSRAPESVAAAARMADRLSARLGGVPVRAAFASAARPTVPEAIRALRAGGARRIALASYFTAPGHFARTTASHPELTWSSAPLGPHPALARLLLKRYDATLGASAPYAPVPL
ncbi:sirohydrochlorin chelatase [Streptomyces sp. ODS28]|uniref:sirohydrochlorin chelatase n=1 Tax=Streptomyces sp. ODS28 TaxID=3136688 RepID=UPI0031F0F120